MRTQEEHGPPHMRREARGGGGIPALPVSRASASRTGAAGDDTTVNVCFSHAGCGVCDNGPRN